MLKCERWRQEDQKTKRVKSRPKHETEKKNQLSRFAVTRSRHAANIRRRVRFTTEHIQLAPGSTCGHGTGGLLVLLSLNLNTTHIFVMAGPSSCQWLLQLWRQRGDKKVSSGACKLCPRVRSESEFEPRPQAVRAKLAPFITVSLLQFTIIAP